MKVSTKLFSINEFLKPDAVEDYIKDLPDIDLAEPIQTSISQVGNGSVMLLVMYKEE